MAADNESPAREAPAPPTRGRGRGRGGRGRGRGGGRGASNAGGVTKTNATRGGRGGTRRGRAKTFTDSRVQAAYERQRELKATYQAVALALKPALQELAERNVDDMLQNPEKYKDSEFYLPVVSQLKANLDKKLAEHEKRLECDLKLAESLYDSAQYVIEQEYKNGMQDLFETYYEGQENRLRILSALHGKGLPVDVRDDQYEYKVITDEHYDEEFRLYEAYKDGHLVPYPSRVEGTEMWQKARNAEAATAAAAAVTASNNTTTSTPTRGRGRGRGGIKRKAMGDPDAQPTPKRSTRNTDDSLVAPVAVNPAPAKGLLASAAEADIDPEGTPFDDESQSGTPEPTSFYAAVQSKMPGKLSAREKSPPLPKNIAEPDEHGVRIYNQKPSLREKGINSRLLAPNVFDFDDYDIGFRDSANDSSKGHTRVKRGKYLDTPNSNGMHFDHWCNAYDFSTTTPQDFDKTLVQRHGVHPKYGIFLPTSRNEQEEPKPYKMPGKPVVFIANPSGRISHASRSFQRTTNHNLVIDAPWRHKLNASLRRFCKMDDIDMEEISIDEYLPTINELKKRSLGTAVQELESRPILTESSADEEADELETKSASEEPRPDLSALTEAAAFVDAQEAARVVAPPKRPAKYDAVRDIFMSESKPAPPSPKPSNDTSGLNFLADLCSSRPPSKSYEWTPRTGGYPGPVTGLPASAYPPVSTSNEREGSYMPATPGTRYQDHRISVGASQRSGEAAPPVYYPSRHQPTEPQNEPAHYGARQPHTTAEANSYPGGPHEHTSPHQASLPHAEYKPAQIYPPPTQDHYGTPQTNYAPQEPREHSAPSSRSYDPYEQRRMSAFAAESPAYSRPYWSQQPQQPPQGPPPPASAAPSQPYLPPPSSRVPFSHQASAEPLPPLRPPRGRHQSTPDELMLDPSARQPSRTDFTQYYQPASSSRGYHSSYAPPESLAPFGSRLGERMLPNPGSLSAGQNYEPTSPRTFGPSTGSPTFGTIRFSNGPSPMGHGSPDTGRGLSDGPDSIFRHRSTPSGGAPPGSAAADPNNKYRKLQPAPVPAHRAWQHKPELKTIPYDHKDSSGGGGAALPNSGPTQIRGWNVNQQRRRTNRSENNKPDSMKPEAVNDREESR